MSWGLGSWGLGPWGIAPATATFSLEDLVAVSERTVRVTFTSAALVGTAFKTGAALNLNTWAISVVGSTDPLYLMAVREVEDSDARQFELYTLKKFPGHQKNLLVEFPTILSSTGAALTGASTGTCAGAKVTAKTPLFNKTDFIDIQNRPVSGDLALGTMQASASGDYEEDIGDALLRKMIMRRLTTAPGEFFHIPADEFGIGLRLKEPLLFSDLRTFKAEIERQVLMEPDAADASAAVSLTPDGVLAISVRVRRLSNGRELTISTAIPTANVVL